MHHDPKGLDLFADDIHREAAFLAGVAGGLRARAEELASQLSAPTHVYLVGCGDSYDGELGARQLWTKLLGVPVDAVPAMTFSTSEVDLAPPGSLVVGLSVSGRVSRVVEAIRAAHKRGFETVSITMNPESPFALEPSTATWTPPFEKLGAIPGTTSHVVAGMALIELGCALADDVQAREAIRDELGSLPDLIAKAVDMCRPVADEHAATMARDLPVLAIGYGGGVSPVRFTVRKMLELTQLVTFWQETEEYAHDEYSLVDERFRVLQFAPPDRGLTRSIEIARYLRRLGVHLAVVTEDSTAGSFGAADVVYPLPACSSNLMPLLYTVPGQLLSVATARRLGGSLYGMAERVHREDGDPQIYESEIVT